MSAFSLTPIASLFSFPQTHLDQSVEVAGWLRSARISKKVAFLVLSDGSCHSTLQVVVQDSLLVSQPLLRTLGAGCSIRVTGVLVASQGAGQAMELQATTIEIVGGVQDPQTYP
jgi:asparaginyl-tRNA synthetase